MASITKFVRKIHFKTPEKEKQHFARKLVGFSSEEMFNVVADVKNYDKFVPFCTKSTVHSESTNNLRATLEIGFPPIIESYTSNVTLIRPKLVRAVCSEGRLFHYLENTWRFSSGLKSNPRSCIIDFYICFRFKSLIHSQIALFFFDNLVSKMEKAFIEEAGKRYGQATVPIYPLEVVKT
ncbi:coenzyme Q-binding protein COQ10 homolog A, mitochondrial [Coccinella septempunctata]|uniref:coenzyme Q-binding protein COQ10 homolog A, mitochondrial n=1 Tax=Coccinella septempunctata TaxID=41139 RepID=UPI001D0843E9|nr:coenzyme Q-binding protein COQ10 homolog A, mitochondrial [Coccinella septempunctata]